jgi:hypothetical protein
MQIKLGVGLVGAVLVGGTLSGCMEQPYWGGRKTMATPAISMPPRAATNPAPAGPADPAQAKAAPAPTSPPEPTAAPASPATPIVAAGTPARPVAATPAPTTPPWPPPPASPTTPTIEPPAPPVATQSRYQTRYPEVPTMPRPGPGNED